MNRMLIPLVVLPILCGAIGFELGTTIESENTQDALAVVEKWCAIAEDEAKTIDMQNDALDRSNKAMADYLRNGLGDVGPSINYAPPLAPDTSPIPAATPDGAYHIPPEAVGRSGDCHVVQSGINVTMVCDLSKTTGEPK